MCRLRNIAMRVTDGRTDRQTDDGQSDPYVSPCLTGDTKTPLPAENSKTNRQHKNATKNFDDTTIANRLRTISWSNNSHPTDMVKPGLKGTNLPIHRNSSAIKRTQKESHNLLNFIDFSSGYYDEIVVTLKSSNFFMKTYNYSKDII